MPAHRLHAHAIPPLDFEAIAAELGVPGPHPGPALDEAADAAPSLAEHEDATHLPMVTVDPPGSRDLDQALHVAPIDGEAGGWRVHYAIADVAAWVAPGGAIDQVARDRTQTYYRPDGRAPLHPPVLGEQRASLLPDGDRPAVLWTIDVDPSGEGTLVDVRRAVVRSRAQLTYEGVQADIDAGRAPDALAPLPELGEALLAASRRRDAIELGLPEQEVVADARGRWTLELRAELPVERWNAQISLLTGRTAAALMLDAGIGLLRTLPAPDPTTFPRLREAARALAISWPAGEHPGAVLADLDTNLPHHAAFADLAAELLRGAAYTAFQGDAPADPGHAGVGAPYAHVTAPLRRLVDRFATEICLAVHAGAEAPSWAVDALAELPERMADGDGVARKLDRACVDAVEAFVLAHRVGDVFAAFVIETGDRWGTVVLDELPVRARCDTGRLPLGERVHVRCTEADVATRMVRFERTS